MTAHSSEFGDMDPEAFRREAHRVADWIADYLAGSERYPVLAQVRPGEIAAALPSHAPDRGESFDAIFADFERVLIPGITHWNHPGFFAYFSITGSAPGILAEFLSAALNVQAMLWRTSPAATELEEVALGWLRRLLGLPDGFEGVIYDTASISTLHALAAARERAAPTVRTRGLAGRSDVAPHARVLLRPGALVHRQGRHPARSRAGVAPQDSERCGFPHARRRFSPPRSRRTAPPGGCRSLSSRPSGPLRRRASIRCPRSPSCAAVNRSGCTSMRRTRASPRWCRGTSGSSAGPSTPTRSSSIRTSGCSPRSISSALYCRHMDLVRAAFALTPEYLKTVEAAPVRNLMDTGVQLGRRFRALKLWMVLRHFGADGLRARLAEHMRLARLFGGWIDDDAAFERVAPVPFSVVCFRALTSPDRARNARDVETDIDAFNERLLEAVNAGGEIFISHTRLNGRYALRLAIGNLHTTETHVARAWALLRQHADDLRAQLVRLKPDRHEQEHAAMVRLPARRSSAHNDRSGGGKPDATRALNG